MLLTICSHLITINRLCWHVHLDWNIAGDVIVEGLPIIRKRFIGFHEAEHYPCSTALLRRSFSLISTAASGPTWEIFSSSVPLMLEACLAEGVSRPDSWWGKREVCYSSGHAVIHSALTWRLIEVWWVTDCSAALGMKKGSQTYKRRQ